MRDDVKVHFCELIKGLEFKTTLLKTLLVKEKDLSDFIKKNNDEEDEILNIIDLEAELIEQINSADFNISQIRDKIAREYRFDFDKVIKKNFASDNAEIIDYRNSILLHEDMMKEIISYKKLNNFKMGNYQKDLQTQISELERMSKIRIVYPKDLRSY